MWLLIFFLSFPDQLKHIFIHFSAISLQPEKEKEQAFFGAQQLKTIALPFLLTLMSRAA